MEDPKDLQEANKSQSEVLNLYSQIFIIESDLKHLKIDYEKI